MVMAMVAALTFIVLFSVAQAIQCQTTLVAESLNNSWVITGVLRECYGHEGQDGWMIFSPR
jgi:hypothetical protein